MNETKNNILEFPFVYDMNPDEENRKFIKYGIKNELISLSDVHSIKIDLIEEYSTKRINANIRFRFESNTIWLREVKLMANDCWYTGKPSNKFRQTIANRRRRQNITDEEDKWLDDYINTWKQFVKDNNISKDKIQLTSVRNNHSNRRLPYCVFVICDDTQLLQLNKNTRIEIPINFLKDTRDFQSYGKTNTTLSSSEWINEDFLTIEEDEW